ncbi:MAG: hypothetical protein PHY73_01265 [Candidatus Omnitrophica bacterium]|nr:hypothetical protein [Candidatus Omnitrophota bacterium]
MKKEKKANSLKIKQAYGVGPSDDCDCKICVFTKSHAPGDSYDVKKCPKYNIEKNKNDTQSNN